MKYVPTFKHFILAAAVSLGLGTAAFAQTDSAEARPTGLLGQNYLSLSYGFVDLDNTGVDVHQYSLEGNQALREGLDAFLGYTYSRSDRFGGGRLKGHDLYAGIRSHLTYQSIKPFVELGAGWSWARGLMNDDSFAWGAGVGAEIGIVSGLTVTPFVRYTDVVDFAGDGTWNYGVEANYWITSKLAVKAGVDLDDDENTTWTAGVNFRF